MQRQGDEPAGTCWFTPAQVKVLKRVLRGLSRKQIADELNISLHTVSFHLDNAYRKLSVHSATAAIARLVNEHLLNQDGDDPG